ncbi:MAG: nucleotidyltransferase domain-containing protein [Bacteroidales bacterium]|nr:nucleotidyltransferase domain-containing protein [Bacteroidales bacterium]
MSIIESNIGRIILLCKQYKVNSLSVFGSVLTDRFTDKSDIDMLVNFDTIPVEEYAENFFNFSDALNKLLGRDIDLVEDKAIRNPIFRENVNRTKVQIYG